MIETLSPADMTGDLRYALAVLDEYQHLGLDAEHAEKLRNILIRRIGETNESDSCCPAQPILWPNRVKYHTLRMTKVSLP